MKRYILYLALVAGLIIACDMENEPQAGTKEPVGIELEFSRKGVPVESNLSLGAAGQSVKIDVRLNNDNLFWNMESDKDWCQVVEEEHRGSGILTLNISANDSFEDREESAQLTFVSGQYEKAVFTVTQSGNFFIIEAPYMVKAKEAGSAVVNVEVQSSDEWDIESDEWITAVKGSETVSGDIRTVPVTISWTENTDMSRYGTISLMRSGSEESVINIWQFGSEFYDESGELMLAAGSADLPFGQPAAEFEIKAPYSYISAIECPEWMSYDAPVDEDNVSTYRFSVERNPSDTKSVREYALVISVVGSDTKITVPPIRQNFYPAGGIISANGLKMFAEAVNAGEDISAWKRGEEVILLNNINMSQLDGEWVSIGTAENPFTGRFNGDYNKLQRFKASAPLFGVCREAVLTNIVFDDNCTFAVDNKAAEGYVECAAAALAAELENCTVSDCENFASVELSAETGNAASAYVSGLVGRSTGATTITNCRNYGTVKVTKEAGTSTGSKSGRCYVAGIAAMNEGTIENCENHGTLSDEGVSWYHYQGGLTAWNAGTVRNARNEGQVTSSVLRAPLGGVGDGAGQDSREIHLGGITGDNEGTIESCENNGEVTSKSSPRIQYVGGIAGRLNSGSVVSGNKNGIKHAIKVPGSGSSTATEFGARQLWLGGLYGQITYNAVLDFSAEDVKTAVISIGKHENATSAYMHIGGLVGNVSADHTLEIIAPKVDFTFELSAGASGATTAGALGIGGVVGVAGTIETGKLVGGRLKISDAVCTGTMTFDNSSSNAQAYGIFGAGGIVGYVSVGGVELTNCNNAINISAATPSARSNGNRHFMGGMAGYIAGGETLISGCTNEGDVECNHYNNNGWTGKANGIGGIVGAYGYKDATAGTSYSIAISNCHNTESASLTSHRGMAGGIAGYLKNGTVSGCDNFGSMANGLRSYLGGIAAVVQATEIKDCKAKCTIKGSQAGSADFNAGGVIGYMDSSSECKSCSYYGNISCTNKSGSMSIVAGGIVGKTDSSCSVTDCSLGGSWEDLVDAVKVTFSAENVNTYAVGEGLTPLNTQYWNGK